MTRLRQNKNPKLGSTSKTTFNRIHFSSKSVQHNTPKEIFNELHTEFKFNFDPAVPPIIGNFSGNALTSKWKPKNQKGRVFVNMPYKRGEIIKWIRKGWKELCLGHAELIVFLFPLRNADYLKFLRKHGAEIRLADKRLKFEKESNDDNPAPFDSAIAILRDSDVKAYFRKIGIV